MRTGIVMALLGCWAAAAATPELRALETLASASLQATHSRVRRNLNELGAAGHHGHHGAHGAHGDHGDHGDHGHHGAHGAHGDHGDHGDHGAHGDHGDHGDHGEHGAHKDHGASENSEVSVWMLISETDNYGCVAKFTCLLEAKNQNKTMTAQEAVVHEYITKRPKDDEVVEMSILKAPYYFAAFVGDRFGSEMCSKFFPDCTHQFGEMLSFVNKFDITPGGSSA